MAKVFLRVYNREIESMIEGGQLDEAVAHCQYILKTFPMHVDTYRLLGKAFLEARRYADAADIFQRVLMAVPDDFVSHVGMSIIRDDENKMDDAIWHMERAFEVQPSNSAIQGELRRLYGRRDGVEPSKIRLSRDALANMYSQGELFNQAIAEIRSVLAEDTNRPDLQVMLARAYYRSGQKVEAAEMAAELLKKYPYCMDSLRVLVDVLPGTARAENTQVYHQRLHNLDPYSSFTTTSTFASDQVVDFAMSLERLDYKSGLLTVSSQPDWASSLGIKLNDEKRLENPPAWMQTAETPLQIAPTTPEPSGSTIVSEPSAEADNVPEWMHSAGWQESNQSAKGGSTDSVGVPSDEPIAKADIPEWLKSMAPTETAEEVNPKLDESSEALPIGEDGIPDWLKPAGSASNVGNAPLEAQQPIVPQPESKTGVPDWLKDLTPGVAAGAVGAGAVGAGAVGAGAVASGEELAESQQPDAPQPVKVEPSPLGAEEVPDWLKPLAPSETTGEVPPVALQQPVELQPTNAEPQMEGLVANSDTAKSVEPAETAEEVPGEAPVPPDEPKKVPVETQPVFVDGFPDWFKPIASADTVDEAHAEAPAQPIETSQAPVETQPASNDEVSDWLKSLSQAETVDNVHDEVPAHPSEPQQVPVESQGSIDDEFPDWLNSMAPTGVSETLPAEPLQQPVGPQPAHAEPQSGGADDVLDWLKSMDSADAAGEVPARSPQQPAETPQPPAEPQAVGVDATPDWLKPLSSTDVSGKVEAEPPQQPVEPQAESGEGIPEWLKSMAPLETAGVSGVVSETAPAEPPYVESVPGSTPAGTGPSSTEAFPDWLTGTGTPADSAAHIAEAKEQPETIQPVSELPVSPEPVAQTPATPPIPPTIISDESFQPAGKVKPLNIGDDAFSWLESLAAKQGAKPEELLTNPEERTGEMPDWLRQPGEKAPAAPVPPAPELIQNPAETLQFETLSLSDKAPVKPDHAIDEVSPVKEEQPSSEPPVESAVHPTIQPASVEDKSMTWLDTLGADQGEKPAQPLESPAADLGTTPDWIQHVKVDQPAVPASEETAPTTAQPVPPEEDTSITSWLSKFGVDEAVNKKTAEGPVEAAPVSPAGDLPDWLKDIEKPVAPIEAPKSDHDLPDWLRQPISSEALDSGSAIPVSDSASGPEMPAWVDENTSVTGQAAPTMPEEWLPAETKAGGISEFLPSVEPTPSAETPPKEELKKEEELVQTVEAEPASTPVPPEVARPVIETSPVVAVMPPVEPAPIPVPPPFRMPTLKQTGMLSHIPVQDKDAELLNSAQDVLDQNSLDDAMKKYTKLIKKGRLLDEVIHDLREAIYRYPVDVIVWQTLGDAYMRANRLQDALDAYTKAEELLR